MVRIAFVMDRVFRHFGLSGKSFIPHPDENSASASEIFAGAVQDYGIGTIVGTVTYGKGVVQELRPLSDGSAVKLTVSDYYPPGE